MRIDNAKLRMFAVGNERKLTSHLNPASVLILIPFRGRSKEKIEPMHMELSRTLQACQPMKVANLSVYGQLGATAGRRAGTRC